MSDTAGTTNAGSAQGVVPYSKIIIDQAQDFWGLPDEKFFLQVQAFTFFDPKVEMLLYATREMLKTTPPQASVSRDVPK